MDPIRRLTGPTLDVLGALLDGDGPSWGLLVIKATGRLAGTVYPILERLERQGWLKSSWDSETDRQGPRRRLYEFTADGRIAAEQLVGDAAREAAASSVRRTSTRPVTS